MPLSKSTIVLFRESKDDDPSNDPYQQLLASATRDVHFFPLLAFDFGSQQDQFAVVAELYRHMVSKAQHAGPVYSSIVLTSARGVAALAAILAPWLAATGPPCVVSDGPCERLQEQVQEQEHERRDDCCSCDCEHRTILPTHLRDDTAPHPCISPRLLTELFSTPVFVVGEATARAARQFGFTFVTSPADAGQSLPQTAAGLVTLLTTYRAVAGDLSVPFCALDVHRHATPSLILSSRIRQDTLTAGLQQPPCDSDDERCQAVPFREFRIYNCVASHNSWAEFAALAHTPSFSRLIASPLPPAATTTTTTVNPMIDNKNNNNNNNDNDEDNNTTHWVFFSPSGVSSFFSHLTQYIHHTDMPPSDPTAALDAALVASFRALFVCTVQSPHIVAIGPTTQRAYCEQQAALLVTMRQLESETEESPEIRDVFRDLEALLRVECDVAATPSPLGIKQCIDRFIHSTHPL